MKNDWRRVDYPSRVVCTTTESVDILYRLGLGDKVVGISGYTVEPPEARQKPKIGAYTSVDLEKIKSLEPDLIVAFSDLQADITRDLVRAGYTVFTLNQRSVRGILEAILMLGALVGAAGPAYKLVDEMQQAMEAVQKRATQLSHRPKIYFEEWYDPLISGIGWVGELIEIAGGDDAFSDVKGTNAKERVISPEQIIARNPEMIIASWCGQKVNLQNIFNRSGWEGIDAIKHQRVYEIKSAYLLQPGPAVLKGLEQIHQLIWREFAAP